MFPILQCYQALFFGEIFAQYNVFLCLVFITVFKYFKILKKTKHSLSTNIFVSNFLDGINTAGVLTRTCPSLFSFSVPLIHVLWFGLPPASIAHPQLCRRAPDVPKACFFSSLFLPMCVCECVYVSVSVCRFCQLTAPFDNPLSGCPSPAAEIELNDDDLPTSWVRKQRV